MQVSPFSYIKVCNIQHRPTKLVSNNGDADALLFSCRKDKRRFE